MGILRPIFVFCGVYYLVTVAFAVVQALLAFDLGSGVSVVPILTAGVAAGQSFVKQNGRLPDFEERWKLSLGAFGLSFVISVPIAAIILALNPDLWADIVETFEKIGLTLFALVAVFVTLLHLGVTYFSLGPLTRWSSRKLLEQARGKPD